jgi:hypothetical protein
MRREFSSPRRARTRPGGTRRAAALTLAALFIMLLPGNIYVRQALNECEDRADDVEARCADSSQWMRRSRGVSHTLEEAVDVVMPRSGR